MKKLDRNTIIIGLILVVALGIILFAAWNDTTPSTATSATTGTESTNVSGTSQTKNTSANTPGNSSAVGGLTAPADTSTTGDQNPYPPQNVTVNYTTKSGFSPSSIIIHTGDTVTFHNQSGEAMWVMSDPTVHPSYPGFDENTSVTNGGNYSMLFTTAGTYDYYNQNQQTRKGTVIVESRP